MMKRILVVLLAIASLFSLAGCGKDETSTDRITVWIMPGSQPAYFEWAKKNFEAENPGLKVNVVQKAAGDLGDKLDATLSKKSGAPDIAATYGGIIVPILVKNNRLMNLDGVFGDTASGASIESKLNTGALAAKNDGGGHFYSAPLAGLASPVIFYNKTYFNSLKTNSALTEPQKAAVKEPSTYAELKALCDVIRSQNKETVAAGLNGWHLPHLMQALGSRTMSKSDYAKTLLKGQSANPFEQDGYSESFDLLKKYVDDGIFSTNASGTDVGSAQTMFLNGGAAMHLAGSLDYFTLESGTTAEIGAFFLPKDNPIGDTTDGPRSSGVYSDCLVVNKNANNPEIVKKFLAFLYTPEAQKQLGRVSLLPTVKGADDSLMPDVLQTLWSQMDEDGFSDFYQNWSYPGVDKKLVMAASGFLNGDSSAAAAKKMIDFYNDSKKAGDIAG